MIKIIVHDPELYTEILDVIGTSPFEDTTDTIAIDDTIDPLRLALLLKNLGPQTIDLHTRTVTIH